MVNLIHNFLIFLYANFISVAALFNSKARNFKRQRLKYRISTNQFLPTDKVALIHCASLGEFELAEPFISELRSAFSTLKIVISFYSPSGFQQIHGKYDADLITYLPMDLPYQMEQFIHLINPTIVFTVKNEFWPNLSNILSQKNIPHLSIYTHISEEKKYFTGLLHPLYKQIFSSFDYIFPSSKKTATIFRNAGYHNVQFAGDGRIEKGSKVANEKYEDPILDQFCKDGLIICAGSSYEEEEKILADHLERKDVSAKIILAPHHIHKANINRITKLFGKRCILYSHANKDNLSQKQVIIVDSIGILKYIYRYSQLAFVGGGFHYALHNVIEPISYGIKVIIGNKYKSTELLDDLLANRIVIAVKNNVEFQSVINDVAAQNFNENQKKIHTFLNKRAENSTIIINYLKNNYNLS